MKQQLRRQPVPGVSAPSTRSLRSGYAFSNQTGFGKLITTVRPRPSRSARIKGLLPRYGLQQGAAKEAGMSNFHVSFDFNTSTIMKIVIFIVIVLRGSVVV